MPQQPKTLARAKIAYAISRHVGLSVRDASQMDLITTVLALLASDLMPFSFPAPFGDRENKPLDKGRPD